MKLFLSLVLLYSWLIANELDDIDSIIKESRVEFSEAKEKKDIKQLTKVAQKLYENHQKIKKLKQNLQAENTISLKCNNQPCENPSLQIGDKLTIIFNLSFEDSEEYEKSILQWQMQHNEKLVRNETKEIYEKGGMKAFEFDINIDKTFIKGKYRIVMHHKLINDTTKAEKFIKIIKPLDVKPLIISKNKDASQSDSVLRSINDLYIISGFTRTDLSKKINLDVKLVDTKKNETIIEGSFVRPKEGENPKFQPLRFKIPANKLYNDQTLKFETKLYADGINPVLIKKSFTISSYKLNVKVRDQLTTGDIVNYSIEVPKDFQKPYKVNLDPKGAILLAHKTNLSGTIEAINKDNETAHIKVQVTDTTGKVAKKVVYIDLNRKKSDTQILSIDRDADDRSMYPDPGHWVVKVYVNEKATGLNKNVTSYLIEDLTGIRKSDNPTSWNKITNILNSYRVDSIKVEVRDYHGNTPVYWTRYSLEFENGYLTKATEFWRSREPNKISSLYEINTDGSFTEKYYGSKSQVQDICRKNSNGDNTPNGCINY